MGQAGEAEPGRPEVEHGSRGEDCYRHACEEPRVSVPSREQLRRLAALLISLPPRPMTLGVPDHGGLGSAHAEIPRLCARVSIVDICQAYCLEREFEFSLRSA